jgi:DHA1 family tetracycline resistance protein-like MFS transporter
MQNTNKKRNLWIIIGITVLNAIGMTIVFPLFPFLLEKYVPATDVALVMSALVSVFAVCTFLAAPVFGALSDRYGRKSILLISLLGSAIGYMLLGIGGALLFPPLFVSAQTIFTMQHSTGILKNIYILSLKNKYI